MPVHLVACLVAAVLLLLAFLSAASVHRDVEAGNIGEIRAHQRNINNLRRSGAPVVDIVRVAVKVEGGTFRFAPADLRLKVTVEPDEANRLLTVEADSGTFYRSTDEDLTGDSPRTRWVDRWRDLPGGEYLVTATVRTSKGEAFKATDRVEIRDYMSGL